MAAADDVYDSWEDMDDVGLDGKLPSFLTATPRQCSHNTDIMSNGSVKVVLDSSGNLDAQMLIQQQPAVKILKRPTTANESSVNGENKMRPVKTFQQRQQEYEQARLRILGEAKSPDDIADEMISKLQLKPVSMDSVKDKPTVGILAKGNVLPDMDPYVSTSFQPKILLNQTPNLVTILRSPKGPDGTRGFLPRR